MQYAGLSLPSLTSEAPFFPLSSLPSQSDISYQLVILLHSSSPRRFFAEILLLHSPLSSHGFITAHPHPQDTRKPSTYPVQGRHSCHVHCQHLACVTHLDIQHKNHSSEYLNRLRFLSAGCMTDLSCLRRMFQMKGYQK